MTAFPITSVFAAAAAIFLVLLSFPIANRRRKTQLSLGDGGDEGMQRMIRTQGNFIEYVPLILIGMALAEAGGAPAQYLWAIGGGAAAGRVLHAFGILRNTVPPRALGMILTFLALLAVAAVLICAACPAL